MRIQQDKTEDWAQFTAEYQRYLKREELRRTLKDWLLRALLGGLILAGWALGMISDGKKLWPLW